MFSYNPNSRCATQVSVSPETVLSAKCCPVFSGSLCVSFPIWEGYLIARGKLQPSKMGCPEEEHAGLFVFLSKGIVGTSHPECPLVKSSSWESTGKCLLS